jgi:hypothetical protein
MNVAVENKTLKRPYLSYLLYLQIPRFFSRACVKTLKKNSCYSYNKKFSGYFKNAIQYSKNAIDWL